MVGLLKEWFGNKNVNIKERDGVEDGASMGVSMSSGKETRRHLRALWWPLQHLFKTTVLKAVDRPSSQFAPQSHINR